MKIATSLVTALWLLVPSVSSLAASLDTNAPGQIPDRYLFILNISTSMRTRASVVQKTLTDLLASGMHGEIRNGDQLGFWTFNDTLHTGEFELLAWDGDNRNQIARRVLEFVEQQRYSRTADFSKVMPEVLALVSESRRITVILLGDGHEVIRGTPFDEAIESSLLEHEDVRKQKQLPIITVLRGSRGSLIGYWISYPPWPVEFPAFPPEPRPEPLGVAWTNNPAPEPDLSRTLVTTNRGPIVFAEPLIVSGTRRQTSALPPEPATAAAAAPAVASTNGFAPDLGQAKPSPAPAGPVADGQDPVMQRETRTPIPASGQEAGPRSAVPAAFLVLGGGLAAVAVVAGGMMWMRRRSKPQTSLITRSMDKRSDSE
ncbi:MAG: DUF2076 domain-containing protein [Verrucomicrobia bacterium]|jgi:hypothetical protein|nr:DUF2076 domain-containing protein [Verrucomicrobiota bacterium]